MNKPTKQTVYSPVTSEDRVGLEVKDMDTGEIEMWVEKQKGYFFTSEQLNEYTQNVNKQKLEFAIEQIKDIDKKCFGGSNTCKVKIKELEQKLSEL